MKRIITLMLAAAMLIGAVGTASAVDVKLSGTWDFAFGFANTQFNRTSHDSEDNNFGARQRFRTQINIIASESLQGVVLFEIGTIDWGRGDTYGQSSGGRLDADGVNIETRRAYLDWIIPETDISIRMGIQGLSLPMAGNGWGNPVFSADVAGVVINNKFDDMFGLTLWWARPFDSNMNDGVNDVGETRSMDDEMDLLGAALAVTGDGWKVTPWFMYADIGAASGYLEYIADYTGSLSENDRDVLRANEGTGTHAWWAGTSIAVSILDPLTFSVDAMYGKMSRQNWGALGSVTNNVFTAQDTDYQMGTSGWFIAAALNYEMDWGTPGIFGWWSSGDSESDLNDNELGRMPVIGIDDGLMATSYGFFGSAHVGFDGALNATGMGTWAIGAQLAKMSFIEKLDHTLRFTYYRGTNEHEVAEAYAIKNMSPLRISGETVYLTDKDSAYEINFDHNYQIYENLTATAELSYIYLDIDEDVLRNDDYANNAWKAQLLFRYAF